LLKHAGFCSGVTKSRRNSLARSHPAGDRVLTLGPLVHNEAVALHLAGIMSLQLKIRAGGGGYLVDPHAMEVSPAIMG